MKNRKLIAVFIFPFLLRLFLANFGTLWLDMNAWIGWSDRLVSGGFKNFYQSWCDYLPSYLYVLWVLGHFKNFLLFLKITLPLQMIYKLPSIFADLATSFLIFEIVKETKKKKLAGLAAFVYLINPAVWANSALWGQADSFFAFFLLLSFYLFEREKFIFAGLTLVFGSLLKPLGFLLLPIFILGFFKERRPKSLVFFSLSFITPFFFLFFPFSEGSIFSFILKRFSQTLNQYPYTSLNAFNAWAILGKMWVSDRIMLGNFHPLSYQTIGVVIFLSLYLGVLISYWTGKKSVYKKSFLISFVFFASFLFLTRMHERHLFTVFPFLNLAAATYPLLWFSYFLSSLIYIFNLYYAHSWISKDFLTVFSPGLIQFFSLVQLVSFLGLPFLVKKNKFFSKFFSKILNFLILRASPAVGKVVSGNLVGGRVEKFKYAPIFLFLILVFSFLTRIINLGYPKAYVFDEVYHAFTADQMVKGNKAAWEWWNSPPKGFAYEWTHPPLAKLIMAGGLIVGRGLGIKNDFFSWRLPAVFFGTAVIFLVYFLTKELLKSEKAALIASFLLACEGLTLVMSRIGMSDIYFLFFILLALFLAFKKRSFLTGICWGLALATKWTGIYLFPLVFLAFVWQEQRLLFERSQVPSGTWRSRELKQDNASRLLRRHVGVARRMKDLGFLLALPPLVYLASYSLFFTSGHTFGQFIELQKQMWYYHTGLKATHNYQSAAYTWPFDLRGVWFYVNYKKEAVGNIYALGNPLIFWTGLIALPLFIYRLFVGQSKKLLLIILGYFIFWVPWIFSPRIMFLYHYLPSLPFLVMILAWELNTLSRLRKGRLLATGCWLLVALSFFFFYPLWTGVPIPKDFLEYFFWLPSWR